MVRSTLAVRDAEAQHTTDHVQTPSVGCCRRFQIGTRQVLTIVIVIATNMVNTIKMWNKYEVLVGIYQGPENQKELSATGNYTFSKYLCRSCCKLFNDHHIRSCVHALRLPDRDGPRLDAILKRRARKGAILDQAARWGSTGNT